MLDASTSIYNLEYKILKKSRILNLSINFVIIVNNSYTMHREHDNFYCVHVYLRSNRISLQPINIYGRSSVLLTFAKIATPVCFSFFKQTLFHNLIFRNADKYLQVLKVSMKLTAKDYGSSQKNFWGFDHHFQKCSKWANINDVTRPPPRLQ